MVKLHAFSSKLQPVNILLLTHLLGKEKVKTPKLKAIVDHISIRALFLCISAT